MGRRKYGKGGVACIKFKACGQNRERVKAWLFIFFCLMSKTMPHACSNKISKIPIRHGLLIGRKNELDVDEMND